MVQSPYEKSRLLLGGLGLLLLCWLLPATGASALEPTANWKLTLQTNEYLEPGAPTPGSEPPGYLVRVKNVGAAATSGEYTLTVKLPQALSISSHEGGVRVSPYTPMSCEPAGSETITLTCRGEVPLQPGQQILIGVPVNVPIDTPSPAVATAEIEGGGVAAAFASTTNEVSNASPSFEFLSSADGVYSIYTGPDGGEITQAGARPTQGSIGLDFPWEAAAPGVPGELVRLPDGGIKDLEVNLPKGVAVNPSATPVKCTEVQLESEASCPRVSQVGTVTITLDLFGVPSVARSPLYAMKTPPGVVSNFGLVIVEGVFAHILGKVRSETDYGLSAKVDNILAKTGVLGFETELWGVPTNASHDFIRGRCSEERRPGGCPIEADERNEVPLLTMPTSCEGQLLTSATAVSWRHPEDVKEGSSTTAPMAGCNQLGFDPTIASQATTPVADSPSGLDFSIHMPQASNVANGEGELPLSTANLKETKVTLPAGMTLNPSAANGLAGCSSTQIGLETPVGQALPVHFDESRSGCPDASKLGSVEVTTPLLEAPLLGSVYLAKPFDNPFGSLVAIYLAVEDQQTGIVAKLPGRVTPDPVTGQLTASFQESPEQPIEDFQLKFFNGPRASLKTPIACGTNTTKATLTPWTTPEGQDVNTTDSFATSVSPRGGTCPSSEAGAPNAPTFSAGTNSAQAGLFSPFSLRIARADGTQQIARIDTTLPEGLTGKLAGIPYCSEAAIALAKSREAVNQGSVEQAHPSCPAASELGKVLVGAGAGISPYYTTGHAYLAGPYKGAPLSLVVITPAVAGPFDLGNVVTRVALEVGEYSAQIHAVSDPLPTIIDGVPLDIRSIELVMDRPGFTLNPTSCEAMSITGSSVSPTGSVAPLKNSFQVGGCKSLAFKPKLSLNLDGATRRGGHPKLKAVLTFPKGATSANVARAQVGLPHSEFLDQGSIGTVCTQPQLKANACPAKSIYGKARAFTPLLDHPLEGPVYLGAGFGHKLPDLVADLNGQIRVLVHGKVDRTKEGGIRNTFEAVPDAPVTKFVLEMKGGPGKGLIENSTNICRGNHKAEVKFTAQNGKVASSEQELGTSCGKRGKSKRHGSKR